MKSKKCILISLPVLCCFICGLALSSELEKSVDEEQTREVSVWIGNDEIPLLFVEKGMPFTLKNAIAADLERVLSHLDKASFEQRGTPQVIPCQNKDLEVTHRLTKRTKGSSVPSDVLPNVLESGHFGKTVRTNGTYSLVIDQEIISEYKTAVTLKNEHPEMFAELDDFIDMLEDQKRIEEIYQNRKACENAVYRTHEHGMSLDDAMDFVKTEYAALELSVRHPSLLQIVQWNKDGHTNVPDDVFVMWSVVHRKRKGVEETVVLPLGAYVNGKWRILVLRLP